MTVNLTPALIATITKYVRYLEEAAADEYTQGTIDGARHMLRLLGIKLEGVND
jgi:hypothetical protein